jgi:hypothetical protein
MLYLFCLIRLECSTSRTIKLCMLIESPMGGEVQKNHGLWDERNESDSSKAEHCWQNEVQVVDVKSLMGEGTQNCIFWSACEATCSSQTLIIICAAYSALTAAGTWRLSSLDHDVRPLLEIVFWTCITLSSPHHSCDLQSMCLMFSLFSVSSLIHTLQLELHRAFKAWLIAHWCDFVW